MLKTNHTPKYFFRFILLDFYLFASAIGCFWEIWRAYGKNEIQIIYLVVFALILIAIGYIFVFKQLIILSKSEIENKNVIEYLNKFHFLCGDVRCGRCSGFFMSFLIIFASIFGNPLFWYSIIIKLDPIKSLWIAIPVFLISTPVPAFIGRMYPDFEIIRMLDNFFIKFILGIITGISLGLMGGYLVYTLNLYTSV